MGDLMTCPACSKDISRSAKTCPGCGHPVEQPFGLVKSDNDFLVKVGFGLFVGIILLATCRGKPEDATRARARAEKGAYEQKCGEKAMALVMAQGFVQKKLRAPATADFPASLDGVLMLECGHWRVDSYVDAQNGFGALIRTSYRAEMRKNDAETWELILLTLDE